MIPPKACLDSMGLKMSNARKIFGPKLTSTIKRKSLLLVGVATKLDHITSFNLTIYSRETYFFFNFSFLNTWRNELM